MKKKTEEELKSERIKEKTDQLMAEASKAFDVIYHYGFEEGVMSRDAEVLELKEKVKKLQEGVKSALQSMTNLGGIE